ncbi:MAG: hypothetical protein U0528_00015 [Anaerolineae bacterium]
MEGLEATTQPRDLAMVFITSVFIWLTETTKYWFVMRLQLTSASSRSCC